MSKWIAEFELEDGDTMPEHMALEYKGAKIDFHCKPLEQEPCGKDINVPATDCISRQEAINSLGECPMNWTDSDGEITAERDWKDTVEMLKRLPSVNPQPKTEVLDKIRAEMFEEMLSHSGTGEEVIQAYADGLEKGLEFIDKYKAESE